MRWFFDTEFLEDGKTIELISIGMVSEIGGSLYWETPKARELASSTDWLRENVLPHLRGEKFTAPRETIALQIKNVLLGAEKPELWAYFADYDWVAFCQLYGRMKDLPEGFPYYCRDLKQLMDDHGIKKDQLPAQTGQLHDALADAQWNREAYLWIQKRRGYYGLYRSAVGNDEGNEYG